MLSGPNTTNVSIIKQLNMKIYEIIISYEPEETITPK